MDPLSTLRCTWSGCHTEFHLDLPMFHVIGQAIESGWMVRDEELVRCPEHWIPIQPPEAWLVLCWTCDYEEECESEEDAQAAKEDHECESDAYIKSPDQLAKEKLRRAEYRERRVQEEMQARIATQTALERQQRIERYARNWLLVRNTIVFWRKESIDE
jgi:hypothetical protein